MFRKEGILLFTTFLCFPGVISATCPRTRYSDLKGTLQSPGNSTGNYPPNQNCTYDVRVPAGKRIILAFDFERFDIVGSMPDCPQDSLEIIVGCGNLSRSLGKFCSCSNLSLPEKIYTYDNCLTLVFISDDSSDGLGFLANYTTTDNNETRMSVSCSRNDLVSSSHGTIFSPFWPLRYPTRANCQWQFSPPSGKIVRLFFTSVEFHPGEDDLVVLNGTNSTGYFKKEIRFLPSSFFVMKNVTAIGLKFSSNPLDFGDGTGFMAGYATYVEGEEDTGCVKRPTPTPTEGQTSATGLTDITTDTEASTKRTTEPTTGTPERLSRGAIVGISIAGAGLCGALIGGLIWLKYRKRSGTSVTSEEMQ